MVALTSAVRPVSAVLALTAAAMAVPCATWLATPAAAAVAWVAAEAAILIASKLTVLPPLVTVKAAIVTALWL